MAEARLHSSESFSVPVVSSLLNHIPRVTSLPDNNVLTLTYNKPGTNETEQCSDSCPLSIDSTIPYQDFLFNNPTITGLEVVLSNWIGAGSGLHLLQLLSDGESSTGFLLSF
jgi:hypothetical protein